MLSTLTDSAGFTSPGRREFILLMAALSALDAFSIDAMIPALQQISVDLQMAVENHRQYVITAIFLGFSVGVLVYGFIADQYGRRWPIIAGFIIYIIGSLACIFAHSLDLLLVGRVLQGLGAAGPYVLALAIVRDRHAGRDMAEILSLIMAVFIGVPMIAPFVGQGVMLFAGWRGIFLVLAVYAVIVLFWFCLRQPETLPQQERKALSIRMISGSITEIVSNSQTLRYALVMAVIFGAFMVYLSTAQQVFQGMYDLGVWFPVVLASLASFFGIGSYLNSRWVQSMGSARLIHLALLLIIVSSLLYALQWLLLSTLPPLGWHLLYCAIILFCFALLTGNVMSLALEPMGHIAGSASSVVTSLSTLVAIGIGTVFGAQLTNNTMPVVAAFAITAAVALLLNLPTLNDRREIHQTP